MTGEVLYLKLRRGEIFRSPYLEKNLNEKAVTLMQAFQSQSEFAEWILAYDLILDCTVYYLNVRMITYLKKIFW